MGNTLLLWAKRENRSEVFAPREREREKTSEEKNNGSQKNVAKHESDMLSIQDHSFEQTHTHTHAHYKHTWHLNIWPIYTWIPMRIFIEANVKHIMLLVSCLMDQIKTKNICSCNFVDVFDSLCFAGFKMVSITTATTAATMMMRTWTNIKTVYLNILK